MKIGLWSPDDDFRVIVAEAAVDEDSPDQTPLKQMCQSTSEISRIYGIPVNLLQIFFSIVEIRSEATGVACGKRKWLALAV